MRGNKARQALAELYGFDVLHAGSNTAPSSEHKVGVGRFEVE